MSGKAPINYYSSQNSTRNFSSKLYQEVPLFDPLGTTNQEKETVEMLSEIYSIIITLDQVEKSFLKDSITADQYTNVVNKLLAQYKTYLSNESVQDEFVDPDSFKKKYNIVASNAITRLERGIPVTVEHATQPSSTNNNTTSANFNAKDVAEATGNFITVMDALKLNYKAKDQLHPLMADLLLSINKVDVKKDFEYRDKLVSWIININKLGINDELNDDEIRELLFDLDMAYKNFYTLLE
ncbi:hypothetical protein KAFR_0E01000 [Kazachstania africana CBS 2517]|uniref:Vacuolar protein sorting-associated protein 28 n=1 Tax=Kazachstania africana (strain ATCC 22294 / BCRC 22015 / CBS 2517 / CECT 1963 / NBRC 1671 / NRRL Y-8276) TaxID=1071382 RepID=H2AV54_KAZAF|nr:hypothetical protein KAFR_0E01000 [Kazachstania africana CBS 2517]CCF58254.1 hypothetical protein KAFR_0E01000 [Kazachstania africana CBS 2517]